jgi:5-formyltetrahydrofolate cyclo-ligase
MVSPSILPPPLEHVFTQATLGIFYSAKPDEPDCSELQRSVRAHVVLPASASDDPFVYATDLVASYPNSRVVIFVPGRQFDLTGTRHGRGGGWYDRFLSRVPHEWIRIGVARQSDVSIAPLVHEPWDEPMDWLLIETDGAWTAYETHARR